MVSEEKDVWNAHVVDGINWKKIVAERSEQRSRVEEPTPKQGKPKPNITDFKLVFKRKTGDKRWKVRLFVRWFKDLTEYEGNLCACKKTSADTRKNLKLLKECKTWLGDGTFDIVPSLFEQLYAIHGRYKDNLIPLIYIVSSNLISELWMSIYGGLWENTPKLLFAWVLFSLVSVYLALSLRPWHAVEISKWRGFFFSNQMFVVISLR